MDLEKQKFNPEIKEYLERMSRPSTKSGKFSTAGIVSLGVILDQPVPTPSIGFKMEPLFGYRSTDKLTRHRLKKALGKNEISGFILKPSIHRNIVLLSRGKARFERTHEIYFSHLYEEPCNLHKIPLTYRRSELAKRGNRPIGWSGKTFASWWRFGRSAAGRLAFVSTLSLLATIAERGTCRSVRSSVAVLK